MYTDDTGKDVYSPWTLEGLATETVSRTQLRAAFFGPNTNGETVASMFADCRCLLGWVAWGLCCNFGNECRGLRPTMMLPLGTHLRNFRHLPTTAAATSRRGWLARQRWAAPKS